MKVVIKCFSDNTFYLSVFDKELTCRFFFPSKDYIVLYSGIKKLCFSHSDVFTRVSIDEDFDVSSCFDDVLNLCNKYKIKVIK